MGNIEKYDSGFVYLWHDMKRNMFYIGSHWGPTSDKYVCSSSHMRKAHRKRPQDFRRRVLEVVDTTYDDLLDHEERWVFMIKSREFNWPENRKAGTVRYYNVTPFVLRPWYSIEEQLRKVSDKISLAKKGRVQSPEEIAIRTAALRKAFQERRDSQRPDMEALIQFFRDGHSLPEAEETFGLPAHKIRSFVNEETGTTIKQLQKKPSRPRPARGEKLKELWADPEWKENQRKRLSEGAKNRPPRSEESRRKASLAQKGKSKNRKNPNVYRVTSPEGETIVTDKMSQFCKERGLNLSHLARDGKWKKWTAEKLSGRQT